MTSIIGVLALHAQYLSTTSRSRGQDVNLNGVKRSRSRLRSGQAVKQEKRWSKFFDPGRSCDYGVNRSDHPLYIPPQTPACTFDALTSSPGIFYETLMHPATRSGSPHNALHSSSMRYLTTHDFLCPIHCARYLEQLHSRARLTARKRVGSGDETTELVT